MSDLNLVTTEKKPHEQQSTKKEKHQPHSGNREERDHYRPQKPNYRRQNKPVYVEDLREKLNRIRSEKEGQGSSNSGPPPDPNYNFLKDPARDGESSASSTSQDKRHQHNQNRRPNEFRNRYHLNKLQTPTTIQPVNIKIELSTNTGQRSYVVDEEHKLAEIKHVPDVCERSIRGRRIHNARHYIDNNQCRNTMPQKRDNRPMPQRKKQHQQNIKKGFNFKGERRGENKIQEEKEKENRDAPGNDDDDDDNGEVERKKGSSEEKTLNEPIYEQDSENETETDKEKTELRKEFDNYKGATVVSVLDNETNEVKKVEISTPKTILKEKTEVEETDLKESIIIEASKK